MKITIMVEGPRGGGKTRILDKLREFIRDEYSVYTVRYKKDDRSETMVMDLRTMLNANPSHKQ